MCPYGPFYLSVSGRLAVGGRGLAGKGGQAPLLLSQTLAAVPLKCRWLSRARLAISRVLCYVAVFSATWPTVSDLSRKKSGMESSGQTLTVFC